MEPYTGEDRRTCGSHEHIEKTMIRLEAMMTVFADSSNAFRVEMTKTMAEISVALKDMTEIKTTLVGHDNRRDSDRNICDQNRAEIFRVIAESNKKRDESDKIRDEKYLAVKTRQDRKDGVMVVIGGISAAVGSIVTAVIMYFKSS